MITLPTPVKEGDEFVGWYYDDNGQDKKYTESTYKLTEDFELVAYFKSDMESNEEGYNLQLFVGKATIPGLGDEWVYETGINGDGKPIAWYRLTSDKELEITLPTPVLEGEIFDGWYYKTNDGEKKYTEPTYKLTRDQHLIAGWKSELVSDIVLSSNNISVEAGKSVSIEAVIVPEDASSVKPVWTSGDENIATVADGVITGKAAGITSVTVKAGRVTKGIIVNVTEVKAEGETSTEEPAELDLNHLMEDTGDGEDLGKIIQDVVESTKDETTGEVKTETKIWVGGLESSYIYTGSQIKPVVHVYDGINELSSSDYGLKYSNNTNVGTDAQIKVEFKGNYKNTDSQTVKFTIAPADLGKDFVVNDVAITATGKDLKPVPGVLWKKSGKPLSAKNLKVEYKDIDGKVTDSVKEAGVYTAVISSAVANYTNTATATVTVINKTDKNRNLSSGKMTLPKSKVTWTGNKIKFDEKEIVVKDSKGNTVDSQYYKISYSGNENP